MISVIIPTYNRAEFIEEAVLSVLRQDFPAFEIIVIDDGSTDTTREIMKQFIRKTAAGVRYFYRENGGAAAARNTGIRKARFDTLCFLDSDDRFLPGKLALQYGRLRRSSCNISHTGETWYRRGELLRQKKKHQPPQGDIFFQSLRMCMVGMSTVMARREIFDRYGLFDETLPCCEDYEFWLRISPHEKFLLVPEPLTLKNGGRPDQLSVRYRQGMDRFRIRALVRLLESGTINGRRHAAALAELERKCRIYGKGCLKYGRTEEGRAVLKIPARFTDSG